MYLGELATVAVPPAGLSSEVFGDGGGIHERRILEDVLLENAVKRGVKEHAVAAADGGLSGLERIPGEAEAGREIGVVLRGNFVAVRRILSAP